MKILIVIFLSVFGFQAAAQCDFPVPAFTISEFTASGISRSAFDQAIDKAEKAFAPIFAKRGCPLVILRSWSDPTINAQAWKQGGRCYVEMFGGLARYPGMSANAFLQVAMHEIGHHLGGRPYYDWSTLSVEGQADYFATSVGMPAVKTSSNRSSLQLARVLAELAGEPRPSRPVPPLPAVTRTLQSHPPAPCRMLTFDAGYFGLERPHCWFKP